VNDLKMQGCDASILLTDPNGQSEQEASPNLTVLGYDIINDIKSQLEQNCTGVVSCADIIQMAARDSVGLVRSYLNTSILWPRELLIKDSIV
jgi:peroxidase